MEAEKLVTYIPSRISPPTPSKTGLVPTSQVYNPLLLTLQFRFQLSLVIPNIDLFDLLFSNRRRASIDRIGYGRRPARDVALSFVEPSLCFLFQRDLVRSESGGEKEGAEKKIRWESHCCGCAGVFEFIQGGVGPSCRQIAVKGGTREERLVATMRDTPNIIRGKAATERLEATPTAWS